MGQTGDLVHVRLEEAPEEDNGFEKEIESCTLEVQIQEAVSKGLADHERAVTDSGSSSHVSQARPTNY